jgi:non-heme chloroperoxidase
MRRRSLLLASLAMSATLPALPASAADRVLTTSDGVRLHLLDQGPPAARPMLFVPGWTMPGWIFRPQLDAFMQRWRVVALDPRGQGTSDIPQTGYEHVRRGQDVAETVAALGPQPVVLVAWSLGVLDCLAYIAAHGDRDVAALVLIDNSIGEYPPPVATGPRLRGRVPRLAHEEQMARFVRGMFRFPHGEAYLDALTRASLRTPPEVAALLLNYPVPRSYWRDAVLSVRKPLLYVVTPRFAGQAQSLAADNPTAETAVVDGLGHALFVDDAAGFNALLGNFLTRRVPA